MTDTNLTFLEVWQQLLPARVKVGGGPIGDAPTPALSSLSGSHVGSDRQSEFYSGRVYARKALALFGLHDADLAVGDDRRPVWPAGYIGSITHTRKSSLGFCAAAVARAEEWSAIGIDAEFNEAIAPSVWPTILTEDELKQIKSLPATERKPEVIRRWCVKEAAIKAAYLPLEPLALETRACGSGCYGFLHENARLKDWYVQTALWHSIVCAAVAVPQ